MILRKITPEIRPQITDFIVSHWYTTEMIIRGKAVDMTKTDGIVALNDGAIIGLITFIQYGDILEITSLDSLIENQGHGTRLLTEAINEARNRTCKKVLLVTTNDNINAIRFYQKRGFDLIRLNHNALDESRKLKPEIPLIGDNNIPLRHELEFEYSL